MQSNYACITKCPSNIDGDSLNSKIKCKAATSSSVNHIHANYMINEQTVDLPLGKNARERDRFMSQFFISFFMFGMHTQHTTVCASNRECLDFFLLHTHNFVLRRRPRNSKYNLGHTRRKYHIFHALSRKIQRIQHSPATKSLRLRDIAWNKFKVINERCETLSI